MGYYTGKLMGVQAVSGDSDAQAFITATGISDSTQISAVNTLVASLKSYGLWTKMKAIYPFVGGTATTHKWNLKDPRDLDIAFRLIEGGTAGNITHSSNGAKGNGSRYYNTYLNEYSALSLNDKHISFYSRTNLDDNGCDIGVTNTNTSPKSGTNIYSRLSNKTYIRNSDESEADFSNTDSIGLFISNRVSAIEKQAWKNKTKTTIIKTSVSLINIPFFIFANNYYPGGANAFSKRECAFCTIGDGLSDTDVNNLYDTIQQFQTTLGRQV